MNKRVIFVCGLFFLSIFCLQIFSISNVQALPGPPMVIYGVINETGSGKNIPAGISVDAYVIDAINGNEWFNYSTGYNATLDLAGYGYRYSGEEFRINDTDPPVRQGNDVYFYINGDNVSTFSFSAGTTERNYTLTDIPEILYVNSSDPGTAGSSYFVNVTTTDLFDTASEMVVKVNWSHGTLSGNTSLSPTGGDGFNGTFILDNATTNLTYTVWVNDSAGNLNSSGPYTITVNDMTAPISSVDSISGYWFKGSDNPLSISATASDNVGLKNVTLYYYHSTDNSSFTGPHTFGVNTSPWLGVSWSFSFPNASGYYRFYSVAIDNASLSESVPLTNDTLCGYDLSLPNSSITIPADSATYTTGDAIDTNISGTATDTYSAIDHVNITIYNSTDGTYWTGTAWQAAVAWLNTNGTTAWYNDSAVPTWSDEKTYYVNATSIDIAGNVESSADSNSFTYDTGELDTIITLPVNGTYYKSDDAISSNITGTTTDAIYNVDHVNITIYNSTDGKYWNGTNWQAGVAWLNTNGTTSWYNDSGIPTWASGKTYTVNATAVDTEGTADDTPDSNSFTYDSIDPNSVIVSPANNADLDSLSNITGTASDSTSGVDYVNITVYNSTNGKYWNGTGWQENVSWLNTNGTTSWYNDSALPTWVNGKDYIINSTAVDIAGNVESSPDSNSFTYDTTDDDNGNSGGSSGGSYAPSGDFTDPSKPTNVTCISIVVDTTPSFTWTAATDNQEVAGYHVKIDDGTEISIGDVLQWTSGILSDGVYKLYVRAEDGSGNLGPYGNCTFTIDTTDIALMMPVADVGGPYTNVLTNQTVLFDGSASTDPDGSIVNYSWNFGDGEGGYGSLISYDYDESGTFNVTLTVTDDDGLSDSDMINIIVNSDNDGDGWSDEIEESYGVDPDDPLDQPVDTDGDGIPDEDSSDGSFTGDSDDDNDGVDDEVEKEFGSNPKDGSDVSSLIIEEKIYYLIDSDDDGIYDGLYVDNETESLIVEKDGVYLLDIDGDGKYDYLYDAILGETSEYVEQEQSDDEIPWLFVIIGIIASAIIAFLILLKLGYIIIER